jgi:hypothetical protein
MIPTKGHSSRVSIYLISSGKRLHVSHVGHSGILLVDPSAIVPPGDARLLVDIDGKTKQKRICILSGAPEQNGFIRFI